MEGMSPSGENVGGIFSQAWWLDTVAPGAWGEARVEKGGVLYARMPYVQRKKLGLKIINMPSLTQTLGPCLRPYQGKYTNQLAEEKELMTALIEQLPAFDIFQQNFHYSITNWLPFYWGGFQQSTRYTYVLEDLTDLDAVWNGFEKKIRTGIRKAERQVVIRDDLSLDQFIALNEMVFRRQGTSLPYSRSLVERIDETCKMRDCRRVFFAQDGNRRIHAAVYIVWDDRSAYYLMGGSDPGLRESGATSLCMWEAIRFASGVTKKFDFEGSMLENVEPFFRAFGAIQKPYFQIRKINSRLVGAAFDVWMRLRNKR
jgi:hypothetical protein